MRYAYPHDREPQPDCGWTVTFPRRSRKAIPSKKSRRWPKTRWWRPCRFTPTIAGSCRIAPMRMAGRSPAVLVAENEIGTGQRSVLTPIEPARYRALVPYAGARFARSGWHDRS